MARTKKITNYSDDEQKVIELDKPQPQFDYSDKEVIL